MNAVTQAGARLIEVGIPDRFSGAGVRDAEVWEYEAAVNERTAAILFVAQGHAEPPLPPADAKAKADVEKATIEKQSAPGPLPLPAKRPQTEAAVPAAR